MGLTHGLTISDIHSLLIISTAIPVNPLNPEPGAPSAAEDDAEHLESADLTDAPGGERETRLLPNAANPNAQVTAGHTIRIPDWMSPNPGFVLDTGSPGAEAVGCYATDSDMASKLPQVLGTPALTLVKGVQGLNGLQTVFTQAAEPGQMASKSVQWQVLPRRTPSTSPGPAQAPAPTAGKPNGTR